MDKVHFSSGKDDWETPDDLFKKYDGVYHFIIDAAANQVNHKVSRWFGPGGEVEDALKAEWPLEEGNIWLNPPYSRVLQSRFIQKAWSEALRVKMEDGPHGRVVCLLPARTDTKAFHEYICNGHTWVDIEFLSGRLKFKGAKSSAPFPSMIVIF